MATAPDQTRNESLISGADAVIESLVRNGVEVVFAYPGGASMPLHQSLTRFGDKLRTILPRHEQGGGFAAQGIRPHNWKARSLYGNERSRRSQSCDGDC